VSVITGAGQRLDALRAAAAGRVLGLEWPQPAAATLDAVEQMADFCRAQDAHLLHLHPFATLSLGGLAAARLGLPYVLTLHGPSNLHASTQGDPLLLQRIAKGAAHVFCVCQELVDSVLETGATDRVSSLPNAVDLAQWRPAARAASGPWAVVGRLDDDKVASVRQALLMLCAPPHGAQARVFGDGGARGGLERWLADQPWGARVRLEGHREDLAAVLGEGFAGVAGMTRVVLEAGALGLPVLLAGYDGVKGLVAAADMPALAYRNFSGRGLPPVDRETLAAQMADLAARPERFQLRPWIEAHADQSRIWARYLEEVAELRAPRSVRPAAWSRLLAWARGRGGH
jgi:glycosyltransferase involved in cell wall biosynthesis